MGPILVTGLVGGCIGALYMLALRELTDWLGPDAWGGGEHLVVLVLTGAVVSLLIHTLGTPSDVELLVNNIHVHGGTEEVRGLRALIPASLVGVAAGSAIGPEAPLVTTTGTIGSVLAGKRGLSREDTRVVAITGMAAGFTVLFGAPFGSAVFALEILHRRGLEYHEALMPAIVGSLCGYAVAAVAGVVGLEPIWRFPPVVELSGIDLGLGLLAGVIGAIVAAAFTALTVVLRRVVGWIPAGLRPPVGGLVLGLLGIVTPYALTNGEFQMEHLAEADEAAIVLVGFAAIKLFSAAVAMVCGWKGGFIIPLFFAGFTIGLALEGYLPESAHSWSLILALMVACNVGVTKTALGSTLVVSEMAGFATLPTTLIAAIVSLVLTSEIGLIDTQRRRLSVDVDGPDMGGIDHAAVA
ncbi:MAG: chloride channel protein [Acidimicrobiales bacterium]|nr:chloride channel protein [Acidimicrobiales bacterium]